VIGEVRFMRTLFTRCEAGLAIMLFGAIVVGWLTDDAGWDGEAACRLMAVRFAWAIGVVAVALGRPVMRRLEASKRRREALTEEDRVAALRALVLYSTTSKEFGRRGT
jgi:hypothetical protein